MNCPDSGKFLKLWRSVVWVCMSEGMWIMVLIFQLTSCQLYSNTFLHVFSVLPPVWTICVYFVASAVHFVPCWEWWRVGYESTLYYWSADDEPKEQNMHSTFQISCIQSFSALCRKCGVSDTLGMIFFFLSLLEIMRVLFFAVVLVNHRLCSPDLCDMVSSLVLISVVFGGLMPKASSCGVFVNKAKRILLSSLFFSWFFILLFVIFFHASCLCMAFLLWAGMWKAFIFCFFKSSI